MPKHTITWTVLPAGVDVALTTARFSVFVSPRLVSDAAWGKLSDFPDWVDWPSRLAKVPFAVELPDIPDPGTGKPVRATATLVSKPDSARWKGLFPGQAPVKGHAFTGFDRRRIRSYPVKHVQDFLTDRWGTFGARSPESFPTLDQLTAPDGFGCIGFEFESDRQGDGRERRKRLMLTLEGLFSPESPDPARWAIPHRPADATTADGVALSFLQLERFHRRRDDVVKDLPPMDPPKPDFHDAVAMSREFYALQRMLGLVLDFECTDPALVSRIKAGVITTRVRLVTGFVPLLGSAANVNVTPTTWTRLGKDGSAYSFAAQPQDPASSDVRRGLLRVGETDRFAVVQVDPDSAALAARQFANNVTRARHQVNGTVVKRSSTSPDAHALPALRSAGFSVGRLSRASRLASNLQRSRTLNDAAFSSTNDKISDNVDLYADDVLRGYRWDIFDETADRWFSLMWRDGRYIFVAQADAAVPVAEEAAVLIAPTTSGKDGDPDLYLQESLVHWMGWSLAVARPGQAVTEDNGLGDGDGTVDPNFRFRGDFRPRDLPRLRFGRRYGLRARAVDLAGNSLSVPEANVINDQSLVTGSQTYGRFEPVPAPEVLLRTPPGEAESAGLAAIRADTGSHTTADTADRHVLPARTSVQFAEQHGKLDSKGTGHPVDPVWWQELATRDAAVLETEPFAHELPQPHEGHWYYDTDRLPVPYLPEVLAKRVLVRGLPGAVTTATFTHQDPAHWPEAMGLRVRLQQGTPGWAWNDSQRLLTVSMRPGDAYRLQLSSQFDAADLDLMGLWPWVQQAAAAWNQAHPNDPVDVNAVRQAVIDGRHWMFTPARTLTLVHAVRMPLTAPMITNVHANRPSSQQYPGGVPGSTHAVVGRIMEVSRKSTGNVEFLANWSMPVDDGPSSDTDPVAPRQFAGSAFTVRMEHGYGPAPLSEQVDFEKRHEFGDTKYRKVTYRAQATTRFAEYFHERQDGELTSGSLTLNAPLEPASVVVEDTSGTRFAAAGVGETDPATASGDFVITNAANGTITRTANGSLTSSHKLRVTFVRPNTRTLSAPLVLDIPSTARPVAPKVQYILPIFRWETTPDGRSVRHGGGLRVYLDRPWWSSGDGEKLGVLLWPDTSQDAPDRLHRHVTMWGNDPTVVTATSVPDDLLPSSFPLATAIGTGLTVPELPGTTLSVAGHDVGFDAERNLWYCDIHVTQSGNTELGGYFPFVRLALARYQPHSIDGCHLSSVVTADFAQLAPDRSVTVTGTGTARQVSVWGTAATTTSSGSRNEIRLTVEQRQPGVTDPDLGWQPAGRQYTATLNSPLVQAGGVLRWQGPVTLPASGVLRLVVEEFEIHRTGSAGALGARLVHTDTVPLQDPL